MTNPDNYGIPRKIWQTYRYKELPRPAEEARASWIKQNPNYEYNFMDDVDIENYILNNWDAETYTFFKALPIGVMKADLWRYLIVADQGGVYSDIDSICCLPIDYWTAYLGSLYKIEPGKPLLFIGIEEDSDKEIIDFCQWTFMATSKHPALEFACKYIVDNWRKNGIDLTSKQVVHLTAGPTILKYALMTYFDEPITMRASDLYKKYKSDQNLRKKLNDLGVYLLSKVFYNGFASIHLVGSTNFKEGYINWPKEVELLGNYSQAKPLVIDAKSDNYGIPRKIWQTYRYKELPRPAEEARASWIKQNPNYEYHFMDDADIENYILNNWDTETYEFFKALPIGVMKADLWRYLILADQGGVYSDIDSICCLPIDYWTTYLGSLYKMERGRPLLLLGMESSTGLCQWTIAATPKHPAMEFACKYILNNWHEKGIDLSTRCFVHTTTGPTVWKLAMLKYFDEPESTTTSDLWNKYNSDKGFKKKVNDLGVYLLLTHFYNGFASLHLNGSVQFGEGYVKWQKERELYREQQYFKNQRERK